MLDLSGQEIDVNSEDQIGAYVLLDTVSEEDRDLVVPADGRAISRETFSALFGLMGTGYGAGDGSTTFNVVNMTGINTGLGLSGEQLGVYARARVPKP